MPGAKNNYYERMINYYYESRINIADLKRVQDGFRVAVLFLHVLVGVSMPTCQEREEEMEGRCSNKYAT